MNLLRVRIDFDHSAMCAEVGLLLFQCAGHSNPDPACTTLGREAECSIGPPDFGHLVEYDVLRKQPDIRSGNTLSKPGGIHLEKWKQTSWLYGIRKVARAHVPWWLERPKL